MPPTIDAVNSLGGVSDMVKQTKQRGGWPVHRTLKVLAIARSSYQRWRQTVSRPWLRIL